MIDFTDGICALDQLRFLRPVSPLKLRKLLGYVIFVPLFLGIIGQLLNLYLQVFRAKHFTKHEHVVEDAVLSIQQLSVMELSSAPQCLHWVLVRPSDIKSVANTREHTLFKPNRVICFFQVRLTCWSSVLGCR